MKVKEDFVTNSSSTGYIMYFPDYCEVNEFISYVKKLEDQEYKYCLGNVHETISNLEELQTYTNDGPLDWAQKPRGPKFYNLSEEEYYLVKSYIENKFICVMCTIDNQVDEVFEKTYSSKILGTQY